MVYFRCMQLNLFLTFVKSQLVDQHNTLIQIGSMQSSIRVLPLEVLFFYFISGFVFCEQGGGYTQILKSGVTCAQKFA